MNSGQLDITFARVARDQGMQQAKDHADAEKLGWSDEAYEYLKKYLIDHKDPFFAEQVREYAERLGLASPPSARAYGPLFPRALREGLIKKHGYGQVSNVNAHACFATIWIKA